MARFLFSLWLLGSLALVAAACGNDDPSGEAQSSAVSDSAVDDQDPSGGAGDDGAEPADGDSGDEGDGDAVEPGGDGDGDGDDGGDGDAVEPGGDGGEPLPGTPFDIGPAAGERLDVIAVRHDDVLNFRTRPDHRASIVDTAAPRSASPPIISSGEGRLLERSAWWKVSVGGQEAWANFAFLGMLGRTTEARVDLEAGLVSREATSPEALIRAIAASRSGGPEPVVTFVSEVEELAGGNQRVIVDVTKLGDDALKGERLALTIGPSTGGYRLVAAERTLICGRGVAGNGSCV